MLYLILVNKVITVSICSYFLSKLSTMFCLIYPEFQPSLAHIVDTFISDPISSINVRKLLQAIFILFISETMSITDQQLRAYIDQVFVKYDRNQSGGLDCNELSMFFNDIFTMTGNPTRVNSQQAMDAMRAIDQNGDGVAQKP